MRPEWMNYVLVNIKLEFRNNKETGSPNTGSGIVSGKKLYQWQTKIRKNLKLESFG